MVWGLMCKGMPFMKKHVFLASVALAVLLAHACKMPPSIEIRADNVGVSIPLRIEANIADIFRSAISNDVNIQLFDMVAHRDAQTFMLAFELDMLPTFNPADYLDNVTGGLDDVGMDPIDASVTVPEIAWEATEVRTYFEMGSLFHTMQNSLNDHSMPEIRAPAFPVPLTPGIAISPPLPPALLNMPRFFAVTNTDDVNFDYVMLSDVDPSNNNMYLTLRLENPESLPNGLSVELGGILLRGADSEIPIGSPSTPQTATLNYPAFSDTIAINLSGAEITLEDTPQFVFGDTINVSYTGGSASSAEIALVVQPHVDNIALRGARGLRIGTLTHLMPEDIIDNIDMELVDGFLNAEIGKGSFSITVEAPPSVPGGGRTFGEGLQICIELDIGQDSMFAHGVTFDGFVGPWRFDTENPLDLGQKTINGNVINVDPVNSFLEVSSGPNGITFELFDEDYDLKRLPVVIKMEMNVDRLDVIRWDMDAIGDFDIEPIEIDFTDMGGTNVAEFIESVTFDKIELALNFTDLDPALSGNVALAVKSPPLGFHGEPVILTKGGNTVDSAATAGQPLTLDLTADHRITVNVEIVPVCIEDGTAAPGRRFLEIGPLYLDGAGDMELALSAEIALEFGWTEARVNVGQLLGGEDVLSGGVPDEPIDLRGTVGNFMSGFTFAADSLDIALFLDGPVEIIDKIDPTIRLYAVLDDVGGGELLFERDSWDGIVSGFPALPDDGVWRERDLPRGGVEIGEDAIGRFLDIFANMPDYLRFAYEVELGDDGIIAVTPEMFDDVYDGAIRAVVIMKIALSLEAAEGAYFSLPSEEGASDLFGRSDVNGPLFGDENLNINSLRIGLEFAGSLFNGARLRVDGGADDLGIPDEDILFGREGLPIGDARGNLSVVITGNDFDVINRRLIPPDIRIVYPGPGITPLRIPRNPLPTRFSISVSGSYTMVFD